MFSELKTNEIQLAHFNILRKYLKEYETLNDTSRRYVDAVKCCARMELEHMTGLDDDDVGCMLYKYLRSRDLASFVTEVLNDLEFLTPLVIYMSWNTGNVDVLENCLGYTIPIEAHDHVSTAIRSGKTKALDFCLENGGDLASVDKPYSHCKTTTMMKHLSKRHGCYLRTRPNYFRFTYGSAWSIEDELSREYVRLGGHIDSMGTRNEFLRREGNLERSLPLKKAFVRSRRPKNPRKFKDLGRVLELPGSVVGIIAGYM